jgi:ABC-type glycerol-3-phosphate transport system substrate-binding protein
MKKTLIALAIAAVVTAPLGAWAAEKEGKITKWETTTRTVTFDDGSTYQFNETVKTEKLKEGARIKVTYEEKDGKFLATKYEVMQ